jgi:RsiW-degrading membrane proteinase PrsW (M82 family)
MELFFASIALGIVPMGIYAFVVWRLDRFENEPLPLAIAAFLWGGIPSIVFAVIAQAILGLDFSGNLDGDVSLTSEFYDASFIAPLTEEIVKGFGVWLIMRIFRREIDSVLDGLIYGSLVGFGFAAVENVFYFWSMDDAAGLLLLFFLRAFVFGMMHALYTGLTGVGLALGIFSGSKVMRVAWPALGLLLAMFCHGLHNYFALVGGEHLILAVLGIGVGLIWFGVMIAVCLFHENRWIRIHLADEVSAGVLRAGQALDAANFWKRWTLGIFAEGLAVGLQRRLLLHQATELAFAKQRLAKRGPCAVNDARIAELRSDVARLSANDPLALSGAIPAGRVLPPPLPPRRKMPPPLPPRAQS